MRAPALVVPARCATWLLAVATLTACPPPKPSEEQAAPATLPSTVELGDRVEQQGTDLYPLGKAPNFDSTAKKLADGARKPGAGIPDETNGVCRLFDPALPEPECCKFESGLDVDDALATCGFSAYLGESVYGSCGYHFIKHAGDAPVTLRAAPIVRQNLAEAVTSHDRQLQRVTSDPSFASTPIPGVPGGKWSRHAAEGLNWAFIPGWSTPRRVSWHDDACDREQMAKLLALMAAAQEPPAEATRGDLLPRKRR